MYFVYVIRSQTAGKYTLVILVLKHSAANAGLRQGTVENISAREFSAVNPPRRIVGSNPTSGAILKAGRNRPLNMTHPGRDRVPVRPRPDHHRGRARFKTAGENTRLGSGTSSRRAAPRALPNLHEANARPKTPLQGGSPFHPIPGVKTHKR